MKKILAIIILFSVTFIFLRPIEDFPKTFPKFQTEDLKGNIITNKIFDKKITAILLWTTDSEPCIKILKNLDTNLPSNCQIIGLIGNKNFDEEIVQENFYIMNLKVNDNFAPILTKIKVVPSVIFVDNYGNLIEPPQFVPNTKFIGEELIRLSELNTTKFKILQLIQEKFW